MEVDHNKVLLESLLHLAFLPQTIIIWENWIFSNFYFFQIIVVLWQVVSDQGEWYILEGFSKTAAYLHHFHKTSQFISST